MDQFRIDAHKLLFHPERVAAWRRGEDIAPLYMEVSPTGRCNHRCRFCGLDFMGYRPDSLDAALFGERLADMGSLGLKSIMYAGEGEPFLHRDLATMIARTRACGIDVAVTTNAVAMKPAISERVLEHVHWIKASLDAGTAPTYAYVHGTSEADFETVFRNLAAAVAIRARQGLSCTLGAQCLLLRENAQELETLAARCRDLGLDYLVVKPYSQHPQGIKDDYRDIRYEEFLEFEQRLAAYDTADFHVVFRRNTMRRHDAKSSPYDRCLALPFWSYIDARGDVWGCSMFLGDARFRYGNINEASFSDIWHGEARRASLAWCAANLDAATCRTNCRMDGVNAYLWELRHPGRHVNFI